MKKLILNPQARENLLAGAKALYETVSVTLGPQGQNVIIEAYGEPIVTHDGVTVAKAIDEVDDLPSGALAGIEMIKASSSKTNDNVGDGTTTSTVLAYHLMDRGMSMIAANIGTKPMVLRRQLEAAAEEVLAELEKLATPITTEKAAIEVATISSERKDIGEGVGKMFHKLGKDGMVAVEIGTKPTTEYEVVEGYTFDRGFISPMMMTDTRTRTSVLHNPAILVAHQTVGLRDVAQLLEDAYQANKDSLVVICDDFKNDLLDEAFKTKGQFEIIGVKAPGFGDQRVELLRDLAKTCGTEVVGNQLPKKITDLNADLLGTCDKIVIAAEETVITGGSDVEEYIKDLQAKLEATKGEFDKDKIAKRIASLRARVGQIRVGGNTEMEAEERKYLVDDAVAATEAALKAGIVPGGATTYVELSRRLKPSTPGAALLQAALLAPFNVLMKNAGERSGKKLEELTEFGKGFDVMGTGELVDLKEHGIIDPVLVVKQAITNAVSVAASALTTGAIIVNVKDKNAKEEE